MKYNFKRYATQATDEENNIVVRQILTRDGEPCDGWFLFEYFEYKERTFRFTFQVYCEYAYAEYALRDRIRFHRTPSKIYISLPKWCAPPRSFWKILRKNDPYKELRAKLEEGIRVLEVADRKNSDIETEVIFYKPTDQKIGWSHITNDFRLKEASDLFLRLSKKKFAEKYRTAFMNLHEALEQYQRQHQKKNFELEKLISYLDQCKELVSDDAKPPPDGVKSLSQDELLKYDTASVANATLKQIWKIIWDGKEQKNSKK